MMKNPELYAQSNQISRVAALNVLENYSSKMKWRDNFDSAIDLGSADGSVTALMKQYVRSKKVKFVGSDINEKMVQFANDNHKADDITFRVQDISGELAEDLRCAFNHVFSFLMLNCVKDQEKAFTNIYDILTDEGDCLLSIIKHVPSYDFFLRVAEHDTWSAQLIDVDKFISPYYEMQNAERKIYDMMEKIGFENIFVECKPMLYTLKNGTELKNLLKSVHPYDIPDDTFEQLARDCVGIAKDIGLLDENDTCFEDHQEKIVYKSSVLIVYANKMK